MKSNITIMHGQHIKKNQSHYFSATPCIKRPPTKQQVFANFWPRKMLQPFITPVLSRFISARLFCVPQIENEVKRAPISGCCWDPRSRNWWIKEGPKRGIFGSFPETVRPRRNLYICQWNISKHFMYIVLVIWIVNSPFRAVSSSSLKGKGHTVTWHEVTEVR